MKVFRHKLFKFGVIIGSILSLALILENSLIFAENTYEIENSRILDGVNGRYPEFVKLGSNLAVISQRFIESGGKSFVGLNLRLSKDGGHTFAEPIQIGELVNFSEESMPKIYSILNGQSSILIARIKDEESIEIVKLTAPDGNVKIEKMGEVAKQGFSLVNPQLYQKKDKSYVLTAFSGDSNSLFLTISRSIDGRKWDSFEDFEKINGIPVLNAAWMEYEKKEILVYQKNDINLRAQDALQSTNQLWVRSSLDSGKSWSQAVHLTNFSDKGSDIDPLLMNNTRPRFYLIDGINYLLWERFDTKSLSKIYISEFNPINLSISKNDYIDEGKSGTVSGYLFKLQNRLLITYFQSNGKKSTVYIAEQKGSDWVSLKLSKDDEFAAFPHAITDGKKLYLMYHTRAKEEDLTAKLAYIEPDQFAQSPSINSPTVFESKKTKSNTIEFSIAPKYDAMGIVGYSYSVDQNPLTEPEAKVNAKNAQEVKSFTATSDGKYYFHVRAVDSIGNWSRASHFSFIVDTTPPPPPNIVDLPVKENGLPVSNTFTQAWDASLDEDPINYKYSFAYLGEVKQESVNPEQIARGQGLANFVGSQQSFSRTNIENGLYLLSVWAIDSVGNISEPSLKWQTFDRYRPSTQVFGLELDEDLLGDKFLNIIGRGYLSEGLVDSVILSTNKLEPYDYVFKQASGEYKITGDRRIEGLVLSKIKTGTYYLGLHHTGRGMSFTDRKLDFPGQGAVKFGDFDLEKPEYIRKDTPTNLFKLDFRLVLLLLFALLIISVIVFSIRRLVGMASESQLIETATQSLLSGKPLERILGKEEVYAMKQKGLNLRIKFILFFIALVIGVVALVAIPLFNYTIQTQKVTLTHGLTDRINVMIDSLVSGATKALANPEQEQVALFNLVEQGKALAESVYVTITGRTKESNDTIYASSDEELKIAEGAQGSISLEDLEKFPVLKRKITNYPFVEGRSNLVDILSKDIKAISTDINEKARKSVGDLPKLFDDAENELNTLGSIEKPSESDKQKQAELIKNQSGISRQLDARFHELTQPTHSVPDFDPLNYDEAQTHYIFYRPVIFRKSGETLANAEYFQGTVRIGVDTSSISKAIATTQTDILTNIAIFAGIAFGAGLIGAFILSSIIIIPINKLVRAVELIRDTQDKEELKDYSAGITTKDELNTLGDIIDQMAHNLAKAAASNKELLVGKDVQKMFIPLEPHGSGKSTIGRKETKYIELFGYYEGAKGVSGDYFNYLEIKPGTFALIKCDVSGKGVPAALIMVQVATLFLDYFENWVEKAQEKIRIQKALGVKNPSGDPELDVLTLHINDLVADMGFVGRFAAFNMVLVEEKTGKVTFCNAGDNIVQIFRRGQMDVEVIKLFKSPASGTFSSKIMPVQFKQEPNHLDVGDILVLATDGIEESKYFTMNNSWELEPISQEDIDSGRVPSDSMVGAGDDELGGERVTQILYAVSRKESFSFYHSKDPRGKTTLDFDFSGLNDTAQDAIMGLICVEKMWRIRLDPSAGDADIVNVDRQLLPYLEKCLVQYRQIFTHPLPDDPKSLYVRFSHLKEFDQYDDLTVLALRRK